MTNILIILPHPTGIYRSVMLNTQQERPPLPQAEQSRAEQHEVKLRLTVAIEKKIARSLSDRECAAGRRKRKKAQKTQLQTKNEKTNKRTTKKRKPNLPFFFFQCSQDYATAVEGTHRGNGKTTDGRTHYPRAYASSNTGINAKTTNNNHQSVHIFHDKGTNQPHRKNGLPNFAFKG